MKQLLIPCLTILLASAAAAQNPDEVQRRVDEAMQRAQAAQQQAEQAVRDAQMQIEVLVDGIEFGEPARPVQREKLPYIGVSTVEAMPVLSEQLGLPRGLGLVVEYVDDPSPAKTAGIKQYDVLMKLDDQKLVNPEQFRGLLRIREAGKEVRLALIRGGKPMDVTVKLSEKEQDVLPTRVDARPAVGLFRAARPGMQRMDIVGGGGTMKMTNINGKIQLVINDDQMTVSAEMKDGKVVSAAVTSRDGKPLFQGPCETPEQRKAMPADVVKKIEEIEKTHNMDMGGPPNVLRLQGPVFGGGGGIVRGVGRSRVLVANAAEMFLLAKFERGKPTHVLAVSTTDGKTLFDGPVGTEEQRKSLPQAVAKQLDELEKNQNTATEFGTEK